MFDAWGQAAARRRNPEHPECRWGGDLGIAGLVGAILFLDSAFYSAIIPILGRLSSEVHFSGREAGFLVGAYAGGMVLAAYPCSLAVARWDARSAVLVGLTGMALACLLFAVGDTLLELLIGRLVQGVAGALSWTGGLAWLAGQADPSRRGRVLGGALGAGVFGAQAGPVIGVVSVGLGRATTFGLGAVVSAAMVLATVRFRQTTVDAADRHASPRALLNLEYAAGMWLTLVPSICLGVIDVLAALRLNHLGVPSSLVGLVFFVAAGLMAVASRLTGIVIDRFGVRAPALTASGASVCCLFAIASGVGPFGLGSLVALASAFLGSLWGPGMVLLADASRRQRVDDGYAFGGFLFAWAVGFAAGSALSGVIAGAAGEGVPYLLSAALCLAAGATAFACDGSALPAPAQMPADRGRADSCQRTTVGSRL